MPDNIPVKQLSERLMKVLDDLESVTQELSTVSDEILLRHLIEKKEISPDDAKDFLNKDA